MFCVCVYHLTLRIMDELKPSNFGTCGSAARSEIKLRFLLSP
jgi:hypothetical protein